MGLPTAYLEPVAKWLRFPGHFAVYPSLYAVGVLWTLAWLLGTQVEPAESLFVLLVAFAAYLIDRVKISNPLLDPADARADPERARLLRRATVPLRITILAVAALASWMGWSVHPVLGLVPPGALVGVILYAGRPASEVGSRLKDIPLLKSVLVAGAHSVLAGAVILATDPEAITHSPRRTALTLLGVLCLVNADAILCDIDDAPSDEFYGTRSIPVQLGPLAAWATVIVGTGASILIATATAPIRPTLVLAGGLVATIGLGAVLGRKRDLVDARLLPLIWLATAAG